jgi:hypothetical protein
MKILIFMMGCFISFGALAGGHEQNEKHKSPYSKNALIKMAKKRLHLLLQIVQHLWTLMDHCLKKALMIGSA